MNVLRVNYLLITILLLQGCVSVERYPEGINEDLQFASEPGCDATIIAPSFKGDVSKYWEEKINKSSQVATNILSTSKFSLACQDLSLSRTLGKTVQEVCREMVCSGEIIPIVNFFNNPNTLALAYEENGQLYINTAKEGEGAGGPGNMMHEFTHVKGYTHLTNWAWLSKNSVPYRMGNLVEKLHKAPATK